MTDSRSSPSCPPTAIRPRVSTLRRTSSRPTRTSTAIYGACGPPIIGAIEAIASAGKTIKVVGFDAGPDEIAAIVAGTELASVAQFPAKMGELGRRPRSTPSTARTVEPNIDTGTEMVTKDNAADFGG